MGLKRVSWVWRYQGQCRALRPLGHQGYRLRNHKKDQPLCSGYRANEAHARLGPECAIGLVSSHMCPTYLLDVAELLRYWEWQGRQVNP